MLAAQKQVSQALAARQRFQPLQYRRLLAARRTFAGGLVKLLLYRVNMFVHDGGHALLQVSRAGAVFEVHGQVSRGRMRGRRANTSRVLPSTTWHR